MLVILGPEVTATSDSAGQVSAARRPVHGADRVARFMLGLTTKIRTGQRIEVVTVNGTAGFALFEGDQPVVVASLTVDHGRIRRVDLVLAPDKLPHHLVEG